MNIKDVKTSIAKLKKYVTKTTVIMALALLAGITIYRGIGMRADLLLMRSELSSSKTLYSIVEKEKHRLDSLRVVYVKTIKEQDATIAQKEKVIANQEKAISALKDSLKTDLNNVAAVSADSSFKYINQRIKPIGELKYPFDSIQVKKIHYTFIERDGLFNINNNLDSIVVDLKRLSFTKDNQILQLKALNNVYLSQMDICTKEKEAYKIQIEGITKHDKKQKRQKNILGGALIGTVTYILINAVVK